NTEFSRRSDMGAFPLRLSSSPAMAPDRRLQIAVIRRPCLGPIQVAREHRQFKRSGGANGLSHTKRGQAQAARAPTCLRGKSYLNCLSSLSMASSFFAAAFWEALSSPELFASVLPDFPEA